MTTFGYGCSCLKVTSITNSEGSTWTFAYDALARMTSKTDPLNNTWSYEYDAESNLTKVTDPGDGETDYTYDGANRLTRIDYPGGGYETITWDTGGYKSSEYSAVQSGYGNTVSYTYDANRNVDKAEQTRDQGAPGTATFVEYEYDDNDLVTKVSAGPPIFFSSEVRYTRDSRDRITLVDDYTTAGGSVNTTVTYNDAGQVSTIERANGVVTTHEYDSGGSLANIYHKLGQTVIDKQEMSRDATGNVTQSITSEGTTDYTYDAANRLTEVDGPNEGETFVYDGVGNTTSYWSSTTGSVTRTYNAADQLTSATDNTTLTYDTSGRLTRKETASDTFDYHYNDAGRLWQVDKNSAWEVKISYYPNSPMWRRRISTGESHDLIFLHDRDNTLTDYRMNDFGMADVSAWYPHLDGLDTKVLMRDVTSGNRYWYHGNNLGTITRMTDDQGSSANSYTYTGYGRGLTASETAGNRFRYTGREWDPRVEMYFYRHRWYDPAVGRFNRMDPIPIGFDGDVNPYMYSGNNPIALVDRSGLTPELPGAGAEECDHYLARFRFTGCAHYVGAYVVCRNAGETKWARCVRKCLLALDNLCGTIRNDCGDTPVSCFVLVGCQAATHQICFALCERVK